MNKRTHAMTDKTLTIDSKEDLLVFEISDEALETAAGVRESAANFTLGACTGLSVCDG
jgi:hypothetical protein